LYEVAKKKFIHQLAADPSAERDVTCVKIQDSWSRIACRLRRRDPPAPLLGLVGQSRIVSVARDNPTSRPTLLAVERLILVAIGLRLLQPATAAGHADRVWIDLKAQISLRGPQVPLPLKGFDKGETRADPAGYRPSLTAAVLAGNSFQLTLPSAPFAALTAAGVWGPAPGRFAGCCKQLAKILMLRHHSRSLPIVEVACPSGACLRPIKPRANGECRVVY